MPAVAEFERSPLITVRPVVSGRFRSHSRSCAWKDRSNRQRLVAGQACPNVEPFPHQQLRSHFGELQMVFDQEHAQRGGGRSDIFDRSGSSVRRRLVEHSEERRHIDGLIEVVIELASPSVNGLLET